MKKVIPILLFACCIPMLCAGYSDGLIGPGEYEEMVEWSSGFLVVDGGGANLIEILSPAHLEVRSTSIPNQNWQYGGIRDIVLLGGSSHIDYYGGMTQELTMRGNATADLYGGSVDYISSFRHAVWVDGKPIDQKVTIHAKPGWTWIYENNVIRGITGQWLDNSSLDIRFTTNGESFGYDPVWTNINVVPEPTTMLLLGLGGLLIRRKK